MATAAAEAKLEEYQLQIATISTEKDEAVVKLNIEHDVKRNQMFQARAEIIKQLGPSKFWPIVLQSHKDLADELMGPYDDQLLAAMETFNVEFKDDGSTRIEIHFKSNKFFQEKILWAEEHDEPEGKEYDFSGVTWNAGIGPMDEDEAEEGEKSRTVGQKDGGAGVGKDRGASLFQFFEEMKPNPETFDDEEEEEYDDDELDEMQEDYEEDHENRMDLFQCLVEEIWEDPLTVFMSK
jgi:hypothetical protein